MESVLLLLVEEVEPVVGVHRAELDQAAKDGIGAHVTVLYPFIPPDRVTSADEAKVADIARSCSPFLFQLTDVGWFGTDIAYLQPKPAQPFTLLTNSVHAAFPEYPPYGGAFDEVIPHLTFAALGTEQQRRDAADAVASELPIAAEARELVWMEGVVGEQWSVRRRFPLGMA